MDVAGVLQEAGDATQGHTPDPKWEVNITSFLTFPHPLHCAICAKNIMVTVLLLQMMGGGSFSLLCLFRCSFFAFFVSGPFN